MKAKELLKNPENWTKKAYARDKKGRSTGDVAPDACSFCLSGALNHCYRDDSLEGIRIKVYNHIGITFGKSTIRFNDHPDTTHAMVLEVLETLDV